jgi:broad specificity phosphatase PhoE
MLRERSIERVVSSPYLRCIQTVECVAAERRLETELSDALVEGVAVDEILRLVEKVSDRPSVLCTHGAVIESLLGYLREHKVRLRGGTRFAKASYWELELDSGEIVGGRYHAPPS